MQSAVAVPLGGNLAIECPDVIVDDAGRFVDELLVERLAREERLGPLGGEGPIH